MIAEAFGLIDLAGYSLAVGRFGLALVTGSGFVGAFIGGGWIAAAWSAASVFF